MKVNILFFLFLICIAPQLSSQQTIEVKGIISELGSSKPLQGCQVISSKGMLLGESHSTGQYSVHLPQGKKQPVYFSFPGYTIHKITLNAASDTIVNVFLCEKIQQIDSVTIFAKSVGVLSQYKFTSMEARKMVSLVGETDVVRYLQVLPGVSPGMEGTLGLFVRGGNSGNNRIELDEIPVYATTHLFGLFSVFHPDIIRDISFQTGGISASSGNFLSSLLEINTKDNTFDSYHGKFSVSPFMADAAFSGPIVKNKLVAQVAGRVSLLQPEFKLFKTLTKAEGNIKPTMADWYSNIKWNIHPNHTIKLLYYGSNDYFQYKNESDISLNWGNSIAKLAWNWKINQRFYLETYAYQSNYYSNQRQLEYQGNNLINGLMLGSSLSEYAINSCIHFKPNSKNWTAKAGANYQQQYFKPASEKIVVSKNENSYFEEKNCTRLLSLFGEIGYAQIRGISLNLGGRGYLYQNGNFRTFDADVRLLSDFYFNKSLGIEVTVDKLSQFYHVLEGLPTGWSLDMMIPSDKRFLHETAWQEYSGIFWKNNTYHFSIGGYYKQMNNLTYYKNSINLFGIKDVTWQEEIVSGEGVSYGTEVRVEKKASTWTWSIAYTLSKTNRHFQEINNNASFPFKFDRRHILNIQSQLITKKKGQREQSIYLLTVISSGHHETIQLGKYEGVMPPYWNQRSEGTSISAEKNENAYSRQLLSTINGYDLPTYIRVDMGYNFKKIGIRYTREFGISIFNVLNNKNPYLIFYSDHQWKQLSIFPILPSVKWSIEF